MPSQKPIKRIQSLLKKGMALNKCKKCGCMKESLQNLVQGLQNFHEEGSSELLLNAKAWLKQMEPTEYSCYGCKNCFSADVTNILAQSFPDLADAQAPFCEFKVQQEAWPPIPGEYFNVCAGETCPVAVSTLSNVELAEVLANEKPEGLCIVGKTETENIGVDKIIKNVITNSAIRVLLLTGKDPEGHCSGSTIYALWKNGVDGKMRVIDSPGKRPVLKNVTKDEVEKFRKQVKVVDMVGCEDPKIISQKISRLAANVNAVCNDQTCDKKTELVQCLTVQTIQAQEPKKTVMDKSGYFVIIPQPQKKMITVEHYSYDNKLQRVIEGSNAKGIYSTIIEKGWVSQMNHAAYLGKELARAELSVQFGFKYIQDGA